MAASFTITESEVKEVRTWKGGVSHNPDKPLVSGELLGGFPMAATFEITESTVKEVRTQKWEGGPGAHRNRVNNPDKPFIAWDGEGYTDESGEHHYNLFGNSLGQYVKGSSLNHEECFELLLSTATKNDAIHVIFSGGYDLVMMIHKLPTKQCERVMKGKAVWVGQYRVQYYRSKWLSLRDRQGRKIILYDVYSFFACAFVKACIQYLGDDETLQAIAAGKLQRSTFSETDLEDKVIPYWKKELVYLVKLCETLRERLLAAGIIMRQWHGPGAVATVVLKKENIKPYMGEAPPEVIEIARHAYYGGRFEQFRIGHYDGPCWQYDINSAYPASIAQLPSFAGATWIYNNLPSQTAFEPFGLYQIRFKSRVAHYGTYPLPWRSDKGRIYYPALIGAPSWYWGIECRNLLDRFTESYEVLESWEPIITDPTRPFAFVEDMYLERQKMKASGNPAQLAVKLAMNSLYGKLAQSKGAKKQRDGTWRIPSYHHLLWAGWITAATRAKLYDAMSLNYRAVIAVETDAVFTLEPFDLPISSAMGDWSETKYNGLTYLQSGVYYKDEGEPGENRWGLKSRGFEASTTSHDKWMEILADAPRRNKSYKITVNRFGSVPGISNWARWYSYERASYFQTHSKRCHVEKRCPMCRKGYSFTEVLHPLLIPQSEIPSSNISSFPHPLPWADSTGYAWENVWDEADFDTLEEELTW